MKSGMSLRSAIVTALDLATRPLVVPFYLLAARELSRHLWLRPILYRHFLEALWRWATARKYPQRRLWRLVILKELGHMAGKMEGNRRWGGWRYFRLWTRE